MLQAPQSTLAVIEREADQTRTRPVAVGDTATITAPTSGTYSLLRPDGTALIDAEAVAITDSVATYAISAAEVPDTEDLGELWVEVWVLLVSGVTYTLRNPAALVLRRLYCPVSTATLLDYHPALATYRGASTSHHDFIALAWDWTQRLLIKAGRRPWLVVGADAVVDVVAYRALGLILRDLALNVGEPERFLALAAEYDHDGDEVTPMGKAQRAWKDVILAYDHNEDGIVAATDDDSGTYPAGRDW